MKAATELGWHICQAREQKSTLAWQCIGRHLLYVSDDRRHCKIPEKLCSAYFYWLKQAFDACVSLGYWSMFYTNSIRHHSLLSFETYLLSRDHLVLEPLTRSMPSSILFCSAGDTFALIAFFDDVYV
jgi:hypothetical protein